MLYTCRCMDGPVAGKEFQDYGPTVAVQIPFRGQFLKYQLVAVVDRGCMYCFRGLSEEGDRSRFFPFSNKEAAD